MTVLDTARHYVSVGLSVIPIRPDGLKQPALSAWKPYQTRLPSDSELIEWFGKGANGIAILGGQISGNLVILDFETLTAFNEWATMVTEESSSALDNVPVATSPAGPGRHVYCRIPELPAGNEKLADSPTPVRISDAGKKPPYTLIETRGEGGYVVAPGSPLACHEVERPYEWVGRGWIDGNSEPLATETFDLFLRCARALNRWADPKKTDTGSFKGTVAGGASDERPGDKYNRTGPSWNDILTPHGWVAARTNGNVTHWRRPGKTKSWSATTGVCKSKDGVELFHVFTSGAHPFEVGGNYSKFGAFTLLNHDGDFAAAARFLAGAGFGSPRKTAGSSSSGGDGVPPEVVEEKWDAPVSLDQGPPVPPFPLEVFPPVVREFVEEVAWSLNCPADFAAVPVLGVASGAIGNTWRVGVTRSHVEPCVLFTLVVGEPGSGKSPALAHVAAPVEAAQQRYCNSHEIAKRLYEDDPDPKKEEPKLRTVIMDETTTEALIKALSDNPRGLCMIRDELAALITGMNQYKGGKGGDRQVYLKLWSAASIKVDRKNNPDGVPLRVPRPCMSIVGGIQPDVVAALQQERDGGGTIDDGFLDRFLPTFPNRYAAIEEQWREVSEEAEAGWAMVVDRLFSLTSDINGIARLTENGRSAWADFTGRLAKEQNDPAFQAHLRGAWAKFKGQGARLALVVRLLWEAASGDLQPPRLLSEADIVRASSLMDYFKGHVRKIHFGLNADRRLDAAERILAWIGRERKPEFKRRDLHMDVKSAGIFPTPESLTAPLNLLEQHGYVREVNAIRQFGSGRSPSTVYKVNPIWIAEWR